MKKMRFSEKQSSITIVEPESGVYDVMVLVNEEKVVEKNDNAFEEESEDATYWQYDGNIFRTYSKIIKEDVESNIDYYLNLPNEEKPTEEMQSYAQAALDNYTASLIESGVISYEFIRRIVKKALQCKQNHRQKDS